MSDKAGPAIDRYAGVNAKQAMQEAADAKHLAQTAMLVSLVALAVAVGALVWVVVR